MKNYPSGIHVLKNMELVRIVETTEYNWQVAFNSQTFAINPLAYRVPLWENCTVPVVQHGSYQVLNAGDLLLLKYNHPDLDNRHRRMACTVTCVKGDDIGIAYRGPDETNRCFDKVFARYPWLIDWYEAPFAMDGGLPEYRFPQERGIAYQRKQSVVKYFLKKYGVLLTEEECMPVPNAELNIECPGKLEILTTDKIYNDKSGNRVLELYHFGSNGDGKPAVRLFRQPDIFEDYKRVTAGEKGCVNKVKKYKYLIIIHCRYLTSGDIKAIGLYDTTKLERILEE